MIYFDNAATTLMSESSLEAYRKVALSFYGNPSSLHDTGSEAENVLESARRTLARTLGVPSKGIHFTGSGSEANFLAVTSLAEAARKRGKHIITTRIEHSSVRNTFRWLEAKGFEVTWLPTDSKGRIEPEEVNRALRDDTILASIQHVNSEIGTVQDLVSIGRLLKEREVLFHSDLVQGYGKLPLDIQACGLHSVTVTAHKIHGPKGIGAAWIDNSVKWSPLIPGSTQERGFRPGTVDVPAAAAFAVAADEMAANAGERLKQARLLRAGMTERIHSELGELADVEGDERHCSPYILGITLRQMEGQHAMLECNRFGLAISTGSACQVNEQKPSATMLAIGKTEEEARRLIRFSFSHRNSPDEVLASIRILMNVISKHRKAVNI